MATTAMLSSRRASAISTAFDVHSRRRPWPPSGGSTAGGSDVTFVSAMLRRWP
jgi:hypothetical protein